MALDAGNEVLKLGDWLVVGFSDFSPICDLEVLCAGLYGPVKAKDKRSPSTLVDQKEAVYVAECSTV